MVIIILNEFESNLIKERFDICTIHSRHFDVLNVDLIIFIAKFLFVFINPLFAFFIRNLPKTLLVKI